MSRQSVGPTQPPVQWVLELKQPGHEVNYSSSSRAGVKNEWSNNSTPFICLCGMDRGKTFYVTSERGLMFLLRNFDG
jgi:hypothetical protein